jgi:type IX secretion system PorP/SprF family membrane protein
MHLVQQIIKRMKKIITGFVLIISVVIANGQAKSSYTQYILNNYILNPALAGIENYTDIKASFRNQWTGINGAPLTNYISLQTPIGKSDYRTTATSNAVPGQNPRGKQYWDDYTSPDPHHGIGFIAMSDKAGYISRWNISASYAYHKPIGIKTTLAAGFNFGVSGINLDRTKATFEDDGITDQTLGLSLSETRKIKPEIGAGLWLYSARYFAGISVLNIIPGKAKFTNADKFGTYFTPNYFATVGYRVNIGENFTLIPSVMVQYWQPQLLGGHANAKLQYMDKAWVGGSYRYSDFLSGYSAMAGFNISNLFNIGYSYEVATNARLRTYTGNTHEIIVGFTLGNKYSDACPRNVF